MKTLAASLLTLCLVASTLAWGNETPASGTTATSASATSMPAQEPLLPTMPALSQPGSNQIITAAPSAPAKANELLRNPSPMQNTTGSGVGNFLQVISALIIVILVLLGCAWAVKNFGPKRLLGKVPVRVVGGVNIGGRERVLVIEVADQWIVIGATPSQITPITTLPRQSMAEDGDVPGKQFSVWLKQIMEKRNG